MLGLLQLRQVCSFKLILKLLEQRIVVDRVVSGQLYLRENLGGS
jgi:hypothetical protein